MVVLPYKQSIGLIFAMVALIGNICLVGVSASSQLLVLLILTIGSRMEGPAYTSLPHVEATAG